MCLDTLLTSHTSLQYEAAVTLLAALLEYLLELPHAQRLEVGLGAEQRDKRDHRRQTKQSTTKAWWLQQRRKRANALQCEALVFSFNALRRAAGPARHRSR